MGKHKFDFHGSEYGQKLKQFKGSVETSKKGNPPGNAFKTKGEHLPPTMCGFRYTGKTTQLKNEKIVAQKRSER